MSDPSNLFIERCADAGKVVGDAVIMHNGLLVSKLGYYGGFSKILQMNKGVHEPAEERMFAEVLKFISDGGTIVELGAYWAFYSMWFSQKIKDAKAFCVEPNRTHRDIGIDNCKRNNIDAKFMSGGIGSKPGQKTVIEIMKKEGIDYIDILHADIQGSELEMLQDSVSLLDEQKINYLFVSTHTQDLHISCEKLLEEHNYRIVASADFDNETFCFDGIIVACHKDNDEIPYTSLGNRKHTKLRRKYEWDLIKV